MISRALSFQRIHWKGALAATLLVSLVFLLVPISTDAAGILGFAADKTGGWLADSLASLLNAINRLILYLLQALQGVLDGVLTQTLKHGLYRGTEERGSSAVRVGWEVVRDLMNMLFAIALLVIGFATILRISSYGMQQALPRFVAAALLVNFSLILPVVVIDASNVLLHFFGKFIVNRDVVLNLLDASRIFTAISTSNQAWVVDASAFQIGGVNFLKELILSLFLVFFMYAILAIVGVLIVRVIALWFLIIMAPFAFLSMVFNFSQGWFKQWLTQLFSWSFVAPAMAFFLYIAVFIAHGLRNNLFIQGLQGAEGAPFDFLKHPESLLSYFVIVVFLYASVYVARKSSAVGASFAVNAAIAGLGAGVLYGAYRKTAKRVDEGLGGVPYFGRRYKAWQDERKEESKLRFRLRRAGRQVSSERVVLPDGTVHETASISPSLTRQNRAVILSEANKMRDELSQREIEKLATTRAKNAQERARQAAAIAAWLKREKTQTVKFEEGLKEKGESEKPKIIIPEGGYAGPRP
ncbi:MAG: hypothetical protein HY460_01980 [Parcubacteria group bacterium]|nr:hypothetical protein [Parcubacteria group bacterium]